MSTIEIKQMELFAKPNSATEIVEWINLHNPENRIALMTVFGMTWNYLATVVDSHQKRNQND